MRIVELLWLVFLTILLQVSTVYSEPINIDSEEILISDYSKEDNPYAIEDNSEAKGDFGLYESMSPSELNLAAEPNGHEIDGHEKHQMPEIKISKHKLIATSQKGYGVAVGITILAGLAFVGLKSRQSA